MTSDITTLKRHEDEILKSLDENRRQQRIAEARDAQTARDKLDVKRRLKEEALHNAENDVKKAELKLKHMSLKLSNLVSQHKEICAEVARHDEVLSKMPERYVHVAIDGKHVVVYGTSEFIKTVETQRQQQIQQNMRTKAQTMRPQFGSHKDQLWAACDRHSAVAAATRDAIKLLKQNNLEVPENYVADLQPGIECYS
jgi:hypothetical protein